MTIVVMSSWRGHEVVMSVHELSCVVMIVHDDVVSTHDLVTAISSCAAMGTHDNAHDNS